MSMKRVKLIIAVLLCAASIVYATDYSKIESRASRFFNQQEWASASAMYDLMIDRKPSVCKNYGYAIVSAGMRNDTLAQISLMDRSLNSHIPLDTLFQSVKKVSFSIGESSLYEDFLIRVKTQYQWLARGIDNYLLEYYVFRNNAPQVIKYSKSMLDGAADNIKFLSYLANGLMQEGQNAEAVETYQKILSINPGDYNALLQLANYFHLTATTDEARNTALNYFEQAQKIKSTPHIEKAISQLRNDINEP